MKPQDKGYRAKALAAVEQGRAALAQGDLSAASYYFAHSLEWDDTLEARVGKAQAFSVEGKLDLAVAECKKAIALDPKQGQPYNDLGVYLMQGGQDDEAVDWLYQAIDAPHMDQRHFPHYNLGRIYERKAMLGQAVEAYEAAILAQPDFASASGALARVLNKLRPPVGQEP